MTLDVSNIEKKLDAVIKQVTERNQKTQEAKQSGPWGWIVGIVLALISLIGIGIAMYLANRRAKELAKLKTQVEQEKVTQEQRAYEAKKEPLRQKRKKLLNAIKQREIVIQKLMQDIKYAEKALDERKKQIDALHAWKEINNI